jgi:hypothetical protein
VIGMMTAMQAFRGVAAGTTGIPLLGTAGILISISLD